jgi:sec-independent protein translocase protein TatB
VFNIGPLEFLVLALVGLIVIGPDKLPGLAKDAAQLLRTLRDLATGAREQLRDELGPEFADVDLRNLNPRAAVQRAVFGDEINLSKLDPRNAVRDAIFGDADLKAADPRTTVRDAFSDDAPASAPVNTTKPVSTVKRVDSARPAETPVDTVKPVAAADPMTTLRPPRPRPTPRPATPYDSDAT